MLYEYVSDSSARRLRICVRPINPSTTCLEAVLRLLDGSSRPRMGANGMGAPARVCRRKLWIYASLLPNFVLYGMYTLYPMVASYWYSLVEWNGSTADQRFVGLANYVKVLADPQFWSSVKVTMLFM